MLEVDQVFILAGKKGWIEHYGNRPGNRIIFELCTKPLIDLGKELNINEGGFRPMICTQPQGLGQRKAMRLDPSGSGTWYCGLTLADDSDCHLEEGLPRAVPLESNQVFCEHPSLDDWTPREGISAWPPSAPTRCPEAPRTTVA